jgi:hypothetical protein
MIYIVGAAVLVTLVRYVVAVRREGPRALLELVWAALAGLGAGVWLGVAARGAMRVVAVAAGAAGEFSLDGSFRVFWTFALFGGGIAIFYAGFFRHALSSSGFRFGLLLIAAMAWPLTDAALDIIARRPPLPALMVSSAAVMAAMWLPYALLVERFFMLVQAIFCSSAKSPATSSE